MTGGILQWFYVLFWYLKEKNTEPCKGEPVMPIFSSSVIKIPILITSFYLKTRIVIQGSDVKSVDL